MSNVVRAGEHFIRTGQSYSDRMVKALAAELDAAEARGRREVLDLVARHVGPRAANAIAAELAQPASVPPLDGRAQVAEDVPDQHRATAPARGG